MELECSFIFFPIQNPGPVQNQNVDALNSLGLFEADCFPAAFPKEKAGVPSLYQPAPPCKFEAMCQSQPPATEK